MQNKSIHHVAVGFADERPRHRGVSHHTLIALGTIALGRATVAVPVLAADEAREVDRALAERGIWDSHDRVEVEVPSLPETRGIAMRSMGRSPADDPAFFAAGAAAGVCAAGMVAAQ